MQRKKNFLIVYFLIFQNIYFSISEEKVYKFIYTFKGIKKGAFVLSLHYHKKIIFSYVYSFSISFFFCVLQSLLFSSFLLMAYLFLFLKNFVSKQPEHYILFSISCQIVFSTLTFFYAKKRSISRVISFSCSGENQYTSSIFLNHVNCRLA